MNKVAIVGKPNVGKSSLFNRLIGHNKSIVDPTPGVTRDRIKAYGKWLNKTFEIIDTGGLTVEEFDFKKNIQHQVNFAINEANTILFIVSLKDGITNDDFYVAKLLKKYKNKQIILVVNKSENKSEYDDITSFYQFGFKDPIFISVSHGIGIGDLLDLIIKNNDDQNEIDNSYPFCIIGRPNVGKSSLVNAILGDDRVIVSDIANTTRDAIDTKFLYNKKEYTIIDTAGIKRKSKITPGIEKYSFIRVNKAIGRSKLVLLMIDASEPISDLDENIGGLIYDSNLPCIIVVNKWDLVENKNTYTMNNFIKEVKSKFKYLFWAPIVFVSAKNKKRLNTIFEAIEKIRENLMKKISSKAITDVVLKAQMMNNPPMYKGNRIKINYVTQIESQLPTFILFCNNPDYLHFSYSRYLENEIRSVFELNDIPIMLYFKSKNSKIRNRRKKNGDE